VQKSRIIVTSVVVEGRSKADVARDYGVTYRWVHTLVTRYLAGGWEAIEPRSRRPLTSPTRTDPAVEEQVVKLRRELSRAGHDAGPHTIAAHLQRHNGTSPAPATIWKMVKSEKTESTTPARHPSHQPRHRRTPTRADTGPHTRLPTPETTKRPPEGERNVNDVSSHL